MTDAPSRWGWLSGDDDASRVTRRKWSVVGTTGVLTGIGHGFGQVAVTAILKPIAEELGLSRAAVASAFSAGRLVTGGMSLVAGHAVDRLGSRRVVAVGTVVMALGLILVAMATGLIGLTLAWALVVSAGTSLAFTVAMDRTVVAHSPEGRGFALAIRFTIVAIVTTIQLPAIVWLVEAYSWRVACATWAALLICTLPLPLLLFEDAAPPHRQTEADKGMSLAEAMRTRTFWLIAFAYMSMAGTISGVSLHSIPMLTDRGWSVAAAGVVVGGLIMLSIPARLLAGIYSDRLPDWALPRLLGLVLIAFSLTLFADALFRSDASALVVLLSKGVATGAPTVLILMICVGRFGQASVGRVQGALMALQVPGTFFAPIIAGYVHDVTDSYAVSMAIFGAFLLTAGIGLQFAIARAR